MDFTTTPIPSPTDAYGNQGLTNPPFQAQGATQNLAAGSVYKIAGTQVMGPQQTGLGTTLAAYTYTGTYSTDYIHLQALHNKVIAIETIIRAQGFATT